MNEVSFHFWQVEDIFLHTKKFIPDLCPAQLSVELVPGLKRPGREADHASPFGAVVRVSGSVPPLPCMPLWLFYQWKRSAGKCVKLHRFLFRF